MSVGELLIKFEIMEIVKLVQLKVEQISVQNCVDVEGSDRHKLFVWVRWIEYSHDYRNIKIFIGVP